jgi:hypothetical protein
MLDGLLIRVPWIDKILDGSKTWEIRGSHTYKEGRIALIESGTGTVVGVAELADVLGPLSLKELSANRRKAGINRDEPLYRLPYKKSFAWILQNPKRLRRPVPYIHPPGAVIWVRLRPDVERAVLQQIAAI